MLSAYNLMDNLISKKFYENKEEAKSKLNVFFAMQEITDEEYTTLTLKVEQMYAEVTEVPEGEVEVVTEEDAEVVE